MHLYEVPSKLLAIPVVPMVNPKAHWVLPIKCIHANSKINLHLHDGDNNDDDKRKGTQKKSHEDRDDDDDNHKKKMMMMISKKRL